MSFEALLKYAIRLWRNNQKCRLFYMTWIACSLWKLTGMFSKITLGLQSPKIKKNLIVYWTKLKAILQPWKAASYPQGVQAPLVGNPCVRYLDLHFDISSFTAYLTIAIVISLNKNFIFTLEQLNFNFAFNPKA